MADPQDNAFFTTHEALIRQAWGLIDRRLRVRFKGALSIDTTFAVPSGTLLSTHRWITDVTVRHADGSSEVAALLCVDYLGGTVGLSIPREDPIAFRAASVEQGIASMDSDVVL